ncbi:dimethylglycine dehydrogenase, mitochondrial-like [Centruroides sculpturatus]|uniref:dimethylglycine dehydrogenase, mitochondrial-like n=1 Tax=Centruroides sculpturatus TaxID=218467 RepID=UPI000C6EE2C8|nr:dimethylglycine dehydrogenase, mitochondrial-like [Centruroides sculpturatus]
MFEYFENNHYYFVGELGWELYHKKEDTSKLYSALLEAGKQHGIGNFGTYALNSLRLEKGFRMWGAEMNMDCNPYEAGLDFFIKPHKSSDFVGKRSLHKIMSNGLTRKLALLKIDTEDVDPEGNESVWFCGKIIGNTTSGAFGYQINHGIAFAYLPIYLNMPGAEVQVELLGKLTNATVLSGPPVQIEALRNKKQKKTSI